jgi:hypothetical protein
MLLALLANAAQKGFRFGILLSALAFGFRHGIDWDHIAAITDITSSQENRRDSIEYGTLYALGHASIVLALGLVAILIGEKLPGSVDKVMTRVVGVTLLLLGVYVFASLIRHGKNFRMRSRWMLIFQTVRNGTRWAKEKMGAGHGRATTALEAEPAIELESDPQIPMWHHGHHGRPGHHHHTRRPEPDEAFMSYGRATAFGVGMIHGVGAETPTQVLIFLSAAGAGGTGVGVIVLVAFIVGLLASNSLITLGSATGFLHASGNFKIYVTVAVLTGLFSLTIGTIFVVGKTTLLPAFFGG